MIRIGDAGEKVRATRVPQARNVRAASPLGVGELHAVVLPPADRADLERARRLFVEREGSAAWARPSTVRAFTRRDRRRDERGPRPGPFGCFAERLDVVAVRARRVDLEARGQARCRARRAPLAIDALIDRVGVALAPDPEGAIAVLALPSVERGGAARARQRRERLVPVVCAHVPSVRRAPHRCSLSHVVGSARSRGLPHRVALSPAAHPSSASPSGSASANTACGHWGSVSIRHVR